MNHTWPDFRRCEILKSTSPRILQNLQNLCCRWQLTETQPLRGVLRVLKVVSAARALNLICPKPMWLKCFGRVFSFAIHAGPAVRTRTKFLRELPEPSASEQASDTNIDGDCLGRRCGRAADDHGTNSPGSGWRSFLPFAVVRSPCREYWRHPAEK